MEVGKQTTVYTLRKISNHSPLTPHPSPSLYDRTILKMALSVIRNSLLYYQMFLFRITY